MAALDQKAGFGTLVWKTLGAIVLAACLVLGLAGIVLPLIPGLLFLGLAALIGSRLSPKIDFLLRRSSLISHFLDRAGCFLRLGFMDKLKCTFWLGVKVVLDIARWMLKVCLRTFLWIKARL